MVVSTNYNLIHFVILLLTLKIYRYSQLDMENTKTQRVIFPSSVDSSNPELTHSLDLECSRAARKLKAGDELKQNIWKKVSKEKKGMAYLGIRNKIFDFERVIQ